MRVMESVGFDAKRQMAGVTSLSGGCVCSAPPMFYGRPARLL